MKASALPPVALGALALGGALLLWVATREGAALKLGSAAANAVGEVGTGVVLGVGDVFGVPRTDGAQCDADLAAGRTWDASFSCPAGRWISEGVFGGPAYTGGGFTPPGGTPPPPPTNPWGGASFGGASSSW